MFEEQKRALRTVLAARRKELASPDRAGMIAEAFFASEFCRAEKFFVYLSFRDEVPTWEIAARLSALGKTVCAPRLGGRDMLSAPFRGELVRDRLGFLSPAEGGEETCEVALVPLLGFDRRGGRLGYGGGYYDRYFAAHPRVLRVGLAYAGQEIGEVPSDATDTLLDAVVTERGILRFGARNA